MSRPPGNRAVSRFELYLDTSPSAAPGWSMDTVREPARLFGANGVRVHADGSLWVSELVGEHLSAWDADNDVLSTVSPMGSELRGPDDIAFDSEGTVYAAETMNGRVSGRRADGTYFVLVDDCPAVNGITVDPETDRLYVDEMREGGRVLEIDRHQRNQVRVIAEGLDWLNALAMGPDRRLYMPQVFAGTVLAVDPESGAVEKVVDGLAHPTAVKFAPDGRLVVAQASIGEVTAVDLKTGERQRLVSLAPGIDNFDIDARGYIYVSNFVEASVARYSMETGELDKVLSAGSFLGPYQVASAAEGFVAADHGSICRVDGEGNLERVSRLLLDQPFAAVGVVEVAGVVVALSQAGEVFRRVDDSGEWVKIFGSLSGANSEYFAQDADGVNAVGVGDGLLLVGMRRGDIVVLELDGTVKSRRPSGLATVTGITGDRGVIVVSDETAGSVSVLGEGEPRLLTGFVRPHGVALTDNCVVIADQGARQIVCVSLDGDRREVVATDLPLGLPQVQAGDGRRSSVIIAPDGSIVVGCDGDGSIRRLVRN
ncbi:SMP-30/gluconolaconase/LRE-like protein [Rhodococcus sp. OK611]|uniref:SMP-30/gluconolactonase/LRE family protein n=1 Tax=unclassified Rhodococcus (in: high G+C Gram-positive bacteria) TaxID=192944 RepID=UPI000BC53449|nr:MULTISPECIES: SMP-30/gluconolactonase/LRE family protein [unclassified Rhodococcus (in: high G+C Gram-positive bacteria)]PTR44995.1 SMP-30/gluconolaconase/LRE-like protein [Rhodococcus sp. OK611]SNX89330.1 SMP-30/Gluconolaconase/LRE-like region-containing protein [Rhodococcus sp. OK270]